MGAGEERRVSLKPPSQLLASPWPSGQQALAPLGICWQESQGTPPSPSGDASHPRSNEQSSREEASSGPSPPVPTHTFLPLYQFLSHRPASSPVPRAIPLSLPDLCSKEQPDTEETRCGPSQHPQCFYFRGGLEGPAASLGSGARGGGAHGPLSPAHPPRTCAATADLR